MRIWYGVNSVGNGHITRARVMAKEFKKRNMDVTFHFSGRPADKFFDMDIFGDYIVSEGLTFHTVNGKIDIIKTISKANIAKFLCNIKELDLSQYDIIISDYEPITSWAGKLQNRVVYGIGHQYAFNYDIPKSGNNIVTDFVMKQFAPVNIGIGLHWDRFNGNILPPIIDTEGLISTETPDKILVYLGFEDSNLVNNVLGLYSWHQFHVYGCSTNMSDYKKQFSHIIYKEPSRDGFLNDLEDCSGVICGSGFELISEALNLGKKVLVKPVYGQMEQLSNAKALTELKYGMVLDKLTDFETIEYFLDEFQSFKVEFPNVAEFLVEHLYNNEHLQLSPRSIEELWNKTNIKKGP